MSYHVVRDPFQVQEVLRRSNEFVPANALTSVVELHPATLRALARVGFALPPVLASASGEQHRRVRTVVARFFTPEKVAAIGPRVVELIRARCRIAAAALAEGHVDLARLTRDIPAEIMADLTGIRCPDMERLKRWSHHSLELFWGWPDPARQLELAESAAEFYQWLRDQVSGSGGDRSLFGSLLSAGLSDTEVCSLGYFLVIAGQETTSQLINIALYKGLGEGHTWHDLADDGSATRFVRTVLASETPVHTWRRVSQQASRRGATDLPAGAEILLELSGNHPPDSTSTAYGLAFGHGIHRCIGAKLAELEAATVVAETARLLPDITLSGPPPEWLRLLSFRTPLAVNVALAKL